MNKDVYGVLKEDCEKYIGKHITVPNKLPETEKIDSYKKWAKTEDIYGKSFKVNRIEQSAYSPNVFVFYLENKNATSCTSIIIAIDYFNSLNNAQKTTTQKLLYKC